jgi:hypothetical protein
VRLLILSKEAILGLERFVLEHVEWVASRASDPADEHFGNWEWGAARGVGCPTQVVVAEQHNRRVGELIDRTRRRTGLRVLSAERDLKGIMLALRRGSSSRRGGSGRGATGSLSTSALPHRRLSVGELAHRSVFPPLPGFTLRLPGGYRLGPSSILVPSSLPESGVAAVHGTLDTDAQRYVPGIRISGLAAPTVEDATRRKRKRKE